MERVRELGKWREKRDRARESKRRDIGKESREECG
jgi:hypothetical protein